MPETKSLTSEFGINESYSGSPMDQEFALIYRKISDLIPSVGEEDAVLTF